MDVGGVDDAISDSRADHFLLSIDGLMIDAIRTEPVANLRSGLVDNTLSLSVERIPVSGRQL
jgi:hypothetical protein